MCLRITFDPEIRGALSSRLVLTVGDASTRSYPMSADDHYRDLVALKFFLSQGTLKTISLGDEPVAAVTFCRDGRVVTLTPYRRSGERLVSGDFNLSQGVSEIDRILGQLTAVITLDKAALERQVAEDITAGVYDSCVSNRHLERR